MGVTNVAVRLNMEGEAEFERSAARQGDALQSAGDRGAQGMDRAAAAADRTARRYEALAAAAKFQQRADANQARFNDLLGVTSSNASAARASAEVFEAEARAQELAEAKARELKAALDPLWGAQQRLAASTREVDELLKRNTITQAQHTAAVGLAQRQYDVTAQRLKNMGAAHGLAAHEVTNLSYQLQDVVVSLGSGQKPMTVLLQQGSQIAQIFATRPGGVGGAIAQFSALLTPARLLVGGFATALLVAGKAGVDYEEGMRALAVTAAGAGRASGLSAQQFEQVAESGAKAGRVSTASARQMATEFAATGKISGQVFGDLIAIQRDFAVATGKDSKSATTALGEAFASPTAGAEKLNAQLGFLNATQLENIRRLEASGDRLGAQKALADALTSSIGGLAQQFGGLSEGLNRVARGAGIAYEALGKLQQFQQYPLGLPAGLQAQVDAANQRTAYAQQVAPLNQASAAAGDLSRSIFPNGLQALQDKQATLRRGALADFATGQTKAALELTGAYDAVSRAISTYLTPAEKAHQLAQLDIRAAGAKTSAQKAAIASERERVSLSGEIVTAAEVEQRAQDAGAKARANADKAGAGHIDSLARQAAAMDVNARAALDLADAYLKDDAAALRAEATRKALTDATRRGADASGQVRRQLALSIAEQATAGAKSIADLAAQAAAQKSVNDQVEAGTLNADDATGAMRNELALRPLLTAQALAEGRSKTLLTDVIAKLTGAYKDLDVEQGRLATIQATSAANDNIAALRLELALVSATNRERAIQLADLRARQELEARRIDPNSKTGQDFIKGKRNEASAGADLADGQYGANTLRGQERQLVLTRAEIGLVGQSNAARDAALDRLQAILDLKQQGIDADSEEGRRILENVADLGTLHQQLGVLQTSWEELKTTGEGLIDEVLSPDTWNNWGAAGKRILGELAAEFLKLAIANPLKNALFGGGLPTLGSVGGLLGGLFKSKAASSATSVLSSIFHFAKGTDAAPGGLSWVGEEGPELLDIPKGAKIHTAAASRQIAAAPQAAPEMHVHVHLEGAVMSGEVKSWVRQGVEEAVTRAGANVPSLVTDGIQRRVIR